MLPHRIAQAAGVLLLVFTLACALSAAPPDTPLPPSPSPVPQQIITLPPDMPTLEIAATQEAPLIQIGFFDSIYLRYDPEVWEPVNETPDEQLNQKGEPVHRLNHRTIPGCFLHENLGRDVPPSWELQVTNRLIGSLEFRVEAWTDIEAQSPVLIVYQYPPGESAIGKRIELIIEEQADVCIQSAEEVLRLSADVIAE
jgi:hypothetical protein